jgi:hypothetical protein
VAAFGCGGFNGLSGLGAGITDQFALSVENADVTAALIEGTHGKGYGAAVFKRIKREASAVYKGRVSMEDNGRI